MIDLFIVSPRLSSVGAQRSSSQRINPAALGAFAGSEQAVFTFTVRHPSELDEIAELEQHFALNPIWVMPAGTAAHAVLAGLSWLTDAALLRLACPHPTPDVAERRSA